MITKLRWHLAERFWPASRAHGSKVRPPTRPSATHPARASPGPTAGCRAVAASKSSASASTSAWATPPATVTVEVDEHHPCPRPQRRAPHGRRPHQPRRTHAPQGLRPPTRHL